ncbi:M24 family metallopeptidase [Halopiger thermotolerans]
MTDGSFRSVAHTPSGGDGTTVLESAHLEAVLDDELASRDATAFVHAGPVRDPELRYCLQLSAASRSATSGSASADTGRGDRNGTRGRTVVAIGYDGTDWLCRSADESGAHPAVELARDLSERASSAADSSVDAGGSTDEAPTTVLTPPTIPHDAALYLESEGAFSLSSTDAVDRARAEKTDGERARIEAAQRAAAAGVRRGASVLASAAVEDGRLVADGAPLTADRLRTAIDAAIVEAGAFPRGNTVVEFAGADDGADSALRPGEPIVLAATPRGPDGYHGRLARTLVVDGDGGRERRAHVAVTQAFRSSRAMLTAGTESVTAVEADLEAEIRAFGEDGRIEAQVAGVGLEPCERPVAGGDDVGPGSVVRLEAAVDLDGETDEQNADGNGTWIRIADVFAKDSGVDADGRTDVERLAALSRSLEPTALLGDDESENAN